MLKRHFWSTIVISSTDYSASQIAEILAHEIGHTLGFGHVYDAKCNCANRCIMRGLRGSKAAICWADESKKTLDR